MTATPTTGRITQEQVEWFAQTFDQLVDNIEQAVLGKQHVTRLALTCLLSEGHLLLEDFPGTGKTQLARALAGHGAGHATAASSSRPTCCPSDVTGVTIYDQTTAELRVPPGPDLRDHRARRRDQPRLARRPSRRCSRSWRRAGSPSTACRTRVGEPVHGHRDPEPDRAGRHLPAARGPARPVPHEDRASATPTTRPPIAVLADAKVARPGPRLQPVVTAQRHRRHGGARRRGPRRPGDARLRHPHRRGVAPAPVAQARPVGARLPRLRPLRQDLGGAARAAPTSSPTTSRCSPTRCCATGCCSTPRPSSPARPSTRSSSRSSATSRRRPSGAVGLTGTVARHRGPQGAAAGPEDRRPRATARRSHPHRTPTAGPPSRRGPADPGDRRSHAVTSHGQPSASSPVTEPLTRVASSRCADQTGRRVAPGRRRPAAGSRRWAGRSSRLGVLCWFVGVRFGWIELLVVAAACVLLVLLPRPGHRAHPGRHPHRGRPAAGHRRRPGDRPHRREQPRPHAVAAAARRAAGRRDGRPVRPAADARGRRARGAVRRPDPPPRGHPGRPGDARSVATRSASCGARYVDRGHRALRPPAHRLTWSRSAPACCATSRARPPRTTR